MDTSTASYTWAFDTDERSALLTDGSAVEFREVTTADAPAIRDLYASLSPESIYARFFTHAPTSIEPDIARMVRREAATHEAIVATQRGAIVAVGGYEVLSDRTKAEIAMVMDEYHHGLGLGSALVRHLATVAAARGVTSFVVEALNRGDFMTQVVRNLGLPVHVLATDMGCIEYEVELT